tara:strand:+ start:6659 stop:9403 length:2745 start_codon:yes stop_codon:yes gene_type:complete
MVSVTNRYTQPMTVFDQRYIIDLIKTRPPQSGSGLVERASLSQLQKAEQVRLNSLVLAPVGYGKTSLLVQLYKSLKSEDKDVAWLSVSEDDSDAVHFLAGVTASLQAMHGSLGNLTQSLLNSGLGVSYRVILTTLLNEILLSDKSITLFLDDLHQANSEEFIYVVSELLESGPENLHLVLASRTSIPSFAKLRARSKLVEITSEDLRVSHSEAEKILALTCPDKLSSVDIFSLMDRVDGWINGLQIAALSINAAKDVDEYMRSFSGRQRDFSEYIEHDIFVKLPDEMQKFLVETSILEVLTPELCDVVTEGHDSERLLSEIQQSNLFLVSLDEEQSCYRYHHFFRDFLRSKLTQDSAVNRTQVHRRAYRWCLDGGLIAEAIDHMESAGDWDVAGQTIADHLEVMLSRHRLSTLKRWIQNLPNELVERSPALLLSLGWVAAFDRDGSAAYCYIEKAKGLKQELHDQLHSNIMALNAVTVAVEDNAEKISLLAQSETVDIPAEHSFFHSSYRTALVYALMHEGKYDQGHRLAIDQEVASIDNNFRAVVYSHIFRGLGYRRAGQLGEAMKQYQLAQQVAHKKFGLGWIPFSVPSALMADIHYEWGQFSTALELLKNQDVVRQESPIIEPLIFSYQASSRLSAHENDVEKALQTLAQGEALGRQDNYSRLVAAMLSERIRLLLLINKLDAAKAVYEEIVELGAECAQGDSWSELNYYVNIGVGRYLIGAKKHSDALPLLVEQSQLAKRYHQYRPLLKLLLLEALALVQVGKQRSAANRVIEAISLGEVGACQQTFLDSEPSVQALIRTALERWSDTDVQAGVKIDPTYIETLRGVFGVTASGEPIVEMGIDLDGLDPLTPKEVTLLRLLRKGLKNKELAEEMHLSVHTIAWHLKNLYSKLGVANRTAAVNVARQMQLD